MDSGETRQPEPRVEETAMTNADKRRSGHVTGAAIGPGF